MRKATLTCLVLAIALAACAPGQRPSPVAGKPAPDKPPPDTSLLHVPSPDWRDQIVYFLMTDRFTDGDPSNNDQGHGEFDPKNRHAYSGGDLEGIRQRLDYIQHLGATAVWLTPPVANVWHDPTLKMAGYHGYWAENFKKLDAHMGTLEDYQRLSTALHGRGMYLIQDVVVNHTGDFFRYEGAYDPQDVAKNFRIKPGIAPAPRPSQAPFSLNDASNPDHREEGVYHWTPDISDYNDAGQRLTHQMSGLDDLNTANPLVRKALRDSYGHWIKTVGVDGYRFDTASYVEHDFWHDFLHSRDRRRPGILVLADRLGKKDFLTFGEVWENSPAFSDKEDAVIARYLGTPEKPEMGALLNFPLTQDLRAVFARGEAPARLRFRLESLNKHYRGGRAALNFVDNHDMPRFLAEGSERALVQALTAVFTIPGIPVVYAGTEQGFTESRTAMFAAGFGSGGADRFDRTHGFYRLIQQLSRLRKTHAVFSRGRLVSLHGSATGPGPLAYRVDSKDGQALVLMNTADEEMLLAGLETGIAPGMLLQVIFSREIAARGRQVGTGGRLSLRMPARSILVLRSSGRIARLPPSDGGLTVSRVVKTPKGMIGVSGTHHGIEEASLIVDGRLSKPIPIRMREGGEWTASFDPSSLPDGEHSLLALAAPRQRPQAAFPRGSARSAETGSGLILSGGRGFSVDIPFVLAHTAADPVGDDKGPSGGYSYPLSKGFRGMADIEKVSLYRRGAAAKLVIKMANGLSDAWNPQFGFDHVCFDVYMDFPYKVIGRRGAKDLPRLSHSLKAGDDWDYAAFLAGWKTALYSAENAAPSAFGTQVQPPPSVKADKKAGTIEVVFNLDAFKGVPSFDGVRFYVTTWDYDGVESVLRPLAEQPADWAFGGGSPGAPRIMDDAGFFP